jgi:cytochrome P450
MRLSPPVPTLLPREVLPGGMDIDGYNVPAGTVVGVPIYPLHHNEEYYPDPFTYRPDRWLTAPGSDDKTAAEAVKLAQSAFCPFSIGPRGCIGKGVAYLELTVALARTLWLYDLRLAPGMEDVGRDEKGMYGLKDIFVAEKDGPVVQFRRRAK